MPVPKNNRFKNGVRCQRFGGHSHFAVSKRVQDGRTFTQISPLDGKERTEEIARMLGGKDLTKVTFRHAEELLANRKE